MSTILEHLSIDPATLVSSLSLTVSDLERSLKFYTDDIGLRVFDVSDASASLGVDEPLLSLREQRGADPWPRGGRSYTGLYHFAILVPTRSDLGAWVRHWLARGYDLGQGDHAVSEALYLEDPDGHGVEIYRDRPRSEWRWVDGHVHMTTGPVDIRGMIREADELGSGFDGLAPGTRLGHMHLQVADINAARAFYVDTLGFDLVAEIPSALFVSAGGYHHHIGMNVWHSEGASPPPESFVSLQNFTIKVPNKDALDQVLERVDSADINRLLDERGKVSLVDPFGVHLNLEAG